MPYSPTTWVEKTTKVGPTNLNKIETALAKMAYAPDASAGFVPVGDGSGAWVYEKLPASSIAAYPADATKFLAGDGTWPVPAGVLLAKGSKTTSVSTAGTTYAAGADLLASAISFTADGSSSYLVSVYCSQVTTGGATNSCNAAVNFDAVQNTTIASGAFLNGISGLVAAGLVVAPAAGAHTVNVRIWSGGAWTTTFTAGAGGATVQSPLLVTVCKFG